MQHPVGQTINGYEIRQQIGEGGFGAVYEAFQPSVGRKVAVKIILPAYAADAEYARRFETEAQLVAKLEHPHIVPLIDYWRDDTGAYLVMRYMPGSSLAEWVTKYQPLELERLRRPLMQIAAALDYAHKHGVIHRDLKPPNLLLDTEENVYLGDFGIARVNTKESSNTGGIGTPYYMSPEQAIGDEIDGRADIYALGITIFELITGKKPYMADTPMATILKHLQAPVPSVRDTRPDVPRAIDIAIQRAMAKQPEDRFATAAEFAQIINDALDQTPPPVSTVLLEAAPTQVQAAYVSPAPTTHTHHKPMSMSNRHRVLDKMRLFWIEGVLENAAYGAALLDLQMAHIPDAVNRVSNMMLEQSHQPRREIRAGTPIIQVFDDLGGELLIMGEPGAGKTTRLLELARDLIERAYQNDQHPIPVVFNLSSWAGARKPLAQWLIDELNSKYQVPPQLGREWIEKDQILPLLDGLDEVKSANREQCVRAINDFRREHGLLPIAICSRTADYEALSERFDLSGAIMLQPLTPAQVDAYLEKAGAEWDGVRQLLAGDEILRQLISSPLMLSIVMVAYQDETARTLTVSADLPERRRHLFDAYVERMLSRRASTLLYQPAQTRHYLMWLARQMASRTMTIFTIESLQESWLTNPILLRLYVLGGLPIAVLIATLVGMATGAIVGYCTGVAAGVPETALQLELLIGFAVGMLLGFVLGLLHWRDRTIRGADRLTLRFAPLNILVGLAAGIFIGIVGYVLAGPAAGIAIGVPGAIISSLALNIRTSEKVDIRVLPNQGIRRIAIYILRFTLGAGVSIALVGWLILLLAGGMVVNPLVGLGYILIAGLAISFAFGMAGGGVDHLIKHIVLRTCLTLQGDVPLNYARFLDFAASRVLLQKVGGGYIFFHRLLLEYFAELD